MEKNKIKILFTISNFDTSGSGKVVYDLAKHLDAATFQVEIACEHNRGFFFKEVEALGLPIHLLEFKKPYRPYFTLFTRINPFRRFIKNNHYNLVHSWHWSSDWTEALAVRLAGVKYIYTKKSMSWGGIHWKIRSFLSSYIITTNQGMEVFFPNIKNKSIIPFGIDTNFLKPDNRILSKNKEIFKIIVVANLVPLKAIEDIMKAMHFIHKDDIELSIIGDNQNDYGRFLQNLTAELKLNNQVLFLGKQLDIKKYLNNADIYIITSKREGLPVALLEAMSMALPVIGSDISGIRYVLNDFPDLLFPQGDIKQLAEKILYFYNMPADLREIEGLKNRQHCIDNFSLDLFIKRHEELYQKLVPKK